jgi:uncharacterized RDD family membrane protein YckC
VSRLAEHPEVRARLGRRAGIVSRMIADAIDLVVVVLIGFLALLVASAIRGLFTGDVELVTAPQPARGTLAAILLVAYLGYGWGLEGRTLGKTAMGLRVVRDDGSDLSPVRGMARAVLYFLVLPGILWALVSRRNASLQDLVLGTSVVYDWGVTAGTPGSAVSAGSAPRSEP